MNLNPSAGPTVLPGSRAYVPDRVDAWSALQAVLSAQRPIAYSVNVARITGDIKSALFLSQLIYWTRTGVDVELHGGWIYKTREQWTVETNLSRYEQESARSHLLHLGLIQEQRTGVPARNCYRVVATALGHALAQLMRAEPVQLTLFDIRENADQVRQLIGRNLTVYPVISEMTHSLTVAVYLAKALAVQHKVMRAQAQRTEQSQHQHLPWDQDWFSLSVRQMSDETGLTHAQQRDAKHKLCQLNLFEEATVTHPKRMTFTRIRLGDLSSKLQQFLNRTLQAAVKTPGLMGAIARGLNKSEGSPKRQTDSAGISAPNWQTSGHPKDGSPSWDTDSRGISSPKWGTSVSPVLKPPTASITVQKSPTSFTKRANQVGDFSHTSRMDLARQMDGFDTVHGLDLAALHARGEFRITNLTTTTTTTDPAAKSNQLDGDDSVVVVHQNLVWPKQLADIAKSQAVRLLAGLPHSAQQDLIDELAGHLSVAGRVKSPVAYLGRLVRLHRQTPGGLVLEMAVEVQERRAAQGANAKRQALAGVTSSSGTAVASSAAVVNQVVQLSEAAQEARKKLLEMRQSWGNPPLTSVAKTSQLEQEKTATTSPRKLTIPSGRSLFLSGPKKHEQQQNGDQVPARRFEEANKATNQSSGNRVGSHFSRSE